MRPAAPLTIVSAFLLCSAGFCPRVSSQTKPAKKNAEATVSGKVTIKGKPAPGVVVGVRLSQPTQFDSTYKASTDEEGIYRISELPAGTYEVAPVSRAFVIANSNDGAGRRVVISEDEHVEGMDFELVRGGVITGKVTDVDGRPAIEESIYLLAVDQPNQSGTHISQTVRTDDRGIYRMFGIRPGHYKVSNGLDDSFYPVSGRGRPAHRPTFYPDATDVTKATVIEIGEGTEATRIDITLGSVFQGYSVNGRVVDEREKPVANLPIILSRITVIDVNDTLGSGVWTGVSSDKQGEFRLENLPSGKYSISIQPLPETDLRAMPVTFDVLDQDVTGLVVKTANGASLAGIVALEGVKDSGLAANFQQTYIELSLSHENNSSSSQSVQIRPDGSFHVGGLEAGIARFSVESTGTVKGLSVSRIEREGVAQPNGIQIQNGEHINGIRLVLTRRNGSVRGVVNLTNGKLPANGRLFLQLTGTSDPSRRMQSAEIDSRGHFLIEGLAAGDYELSIFAYVPGSSQRLPNTKQPVTVSDGAETEVVVTLDLTVSP